MHCSNCFTDLQRPANLFSPKTSPRLYLRRPFSKACSSMHGPTTVQKSCRRGGLKRLGRGPESSGLWQKMISCLLQMTKASWKMNSPPKSTLGYHFSYFSLTSAVVSRAFGSDYQTIPCLIYCYCQDSRYCASQVWRASDCCLHYRCSMQVDLPPRGLFPWYSRTLQRRLVVQRAHPRRVDSTTGKRGLGDWLYYAPQRESSAVVDHPCHNSSAFSMASSQKTHLPWAFPLRSCPV